MTALRWPSSNIQLGPSRASTSCAKSVWPIEDKGFCSMHTWQGCVRGCATSCLSHIIFLKLLHNFEHTSRCHRYGLVH